LFEVAKERGKRSQEVSQNSVSAVPGPKRSLLLWKIGPRYGKMRVTLILRRGEEHKWDGKAKCPSTA